MSNDDEDVYFYAGDVVLVKNLDDEEKHSLEPGDVISFISQNSDSFGETITHMIRERTTNEDGDLAYRTFGTATGENDAVLVEPEYILGEYTGKIPKLGRFFNFLRTTPGYIVCILVPFLLLILWQGVNTVRLFRKYRAEQMADMKAERQKLAEEREQSAQMMRELQALREQLAQSAPGGTTQTPDENNTAENADTNPKQE
jgi:hypothetical protein